MLLIKVDLVCVSFVIFSYSETWLLDYGRSFSPPYTVLELPISGSICVCLLITLFDIF